MAEMKAGQVQVYFGGQGSGKTFLAHYHISTKSRVLLHDINCTPELAKGSRVIESKYDLLAAVSVPGPMKLCWRGYASGDKWEMFEWANRAALAGEGFAVLWDEADLLIGNNLPRGSHAERLVNAGRHRKCSLYATSRRPQKMPRDVVDAATRIDAAKIISSKVIDYLSEQTDQDWSGLRNVKKYEFLDWNGSRLAVKKSPFS